MGSNATLSAFGVEALGDPPGVLLLELPCRPLGGLLPAWDALVAIRDWARKRDVPMHLDGARIWQCRGFYGKSFAEIASLFDSVYVSFYKDLGGLCGCMLMGDADFIATSRIWQRRYGGNLYTQAPLVASARLGLARNLPQMQTGSPGPVKSRRSWAVFQEYESSPIRRRSISSSCSSRATTKPCRNGTSRWPRRPARFVSTAWDRRPSRGSP